MNEFTEDLGEMASSMKSTEGGMKQMLNKDHGNCFKKECSSH
jgi:hypothetical protein